MFQKSENFKILDLSFRGVLNSQDSRLIDKIFPEALKNFNLFLEDIVASNFLKREDLFLNFTSRNPFSCPLLDFFCKFELFKQKIMLGHQVNKIIVDSSSSEIYTSYIKDNQLSLKVIIKKKYKFRSQLLSNFFKIFSISSMLITLPKFFRFDKPRRKIVILDTFITPVSFDNNGVYLDKYFTGFENFLDPVLLEDLWILPNFYDFKNPIDLYKAYKNIKSSGRNFLVQDGFLSIKDILQSILFSIKTPLRIVNFPEIENCNSKKLLRAIIKEEVLSTNLFRAHLKYLFIKKIKNANIEVNLVISWFENQPKDRALCAGFKKFFSNVLIRGYQGFPVLPYYAGQQPTCYENDLKVIPDEIHVISKLYVEDKKRVCEKLKILVSPAYRYSYLHNLLLKDKPSEYKILVALPGIIEECIPIIEICKLVKERLKNKVTFLLKIHPQYSIKSFRKKINFHPIDCFELNSDPLHKTFKCISMLITSGSSIAVEAVSIGIPVAVCANNNGVTLNFIPQRIKGIKWKVIYSPEELEIFINENQGLDHRDNKMSKTLFKPTSKIFSDNLFTIPTHF